MVKITEMPAALMNYPGDDHQKLFASGLFNIISEIRSKTINQNITGTYDFAGGSTDVKIVIPGLGAEDHLTITIVTQTNPAIKQSQNIPPAGGEVDLTFNVDPGVTKFSYILKKGDS